LHLLKRSFPISILVQFSTSQSILQVTFTTVRQRSHSLTFQTLASQRIPRGQWRQFDAIELGALADAITVLILSKGKK